MSGNIMRVSIIPYRPHTALEKNESGYFASGPMGNIFNALVQVLKFNYAIAIPKEITTGSPQPDGSWTGSMGMLHRNESDLAMGPFFPAEERLAIAKPTSMFYLEDLRILAGRPSAAESNVFGYILAFDWMVWMFLLIALFVVTLLTSVIEVRNQGHALFLKRVLSTMNDVLWHYLKNMFFEGGISQRCSCRVYSHVLRYTASTYVPRTTALRIVNASWWIAIIVLMNAFCGHLRACLMIKSEVEKINTVHQLVRNPRVVPFMWKGTSYVAMVAHSSNEDLQKIGLVVHESDTAQPSSVLYGTTLLKQVASGRAVIISDSTSLVFRVTSTCRGFRDGEFYLADESLVAHPLNSFVRKDMDPRLLEDINKVIRHLVEAGLVDYWWITATGDMSTCSKGGQKDSATTLAFSDLRAVFVLLLAGVLFAVAALLAELCIRRGAKPRSFKKYNTSRVLGRNR